MLLGLSEFYLVLLALPSSTGFLIRLAWFLLWFNEVLLGFDEVNLVLPKFAGVLLRFTVLFFVRKMKRCIGAVPCGLCTEFYWVLPSLTRYYWVLPGFTVFYRVLPSFTGAYWVLLGFIGFY